MREARSGPASSARAGAWSARCRAARPARARAGAGCRGPGGPSGSPSPAGPPSPRTSKGARPARSPPQPPRCAPYGNLTRPLALLRGMVPTAMDGVLRKLATRLGPVHGEPMPLDGGMTGRVFRVGLGAGDYVVHLPGKDTGALGIDRGAEQDATRAAARVGVGPEVAAYLPDSDVLVTRYVDGRPLRMDEVSEPDVLADVAETLRALHKGPRLRSGGGGAAARPETGARRGGEKNLSPFRAVERYREIATDRGVEADAR